MIRAGVVTMAFALLVDVIAHLEAPAHAGHLHEHTSTQVWAHVGVLVGMVLVISGVVIDGVRQQRARRRSAGRTSKGVD